MLLKTNDDLDLGKIADSGQCFRWEQMGPDEFRIPYRERRLYIKDLGAGRFELDCTVEQEADSRRYFDLDEDYRSIRSIPDPEKDPFLARAAEAEKGIRILRQDPWEVTVSFIISQNRSIPAIRRSVELLCSAAGRQCLDDRGEAFYAFPSPREILRLTDRELNECRLGYRCRYVRAAAEAAESGALDLDLLTRADCETARSALTAICGVGIKVASCVQLFGLHQLNSFPIDTWMRRILANEYPQGYPFEEYTPYNGVFQQYMFAYYRNEHIRGRL